MIVDAHAHILPDRVRDGSAELLQGEAWFATCHASGKAMASAESLVAAMDRDGVDVTVCFAWPFADPALCHEANDYVAAAVRRHPGRLVGFGVVQPNDPGAVAELRRCAQLGLRGVGEMNADAQGWDLLGAAPGAVVAASVEMGLPWTLHCSEPVGRAYPGKGSTTPDRLLAFAERHPELTLVCAHLGGGLPLLAHIAEVARTCAHLHFDTAAQPFVYEASVYPALIGTIGADRILLGSDHPLLDVPRYTAALAAAGVAEPARQLITGANAVRLLHL